MLQWTASVSRWHEWFDLIDTVSRLEAVILLEAIDLGMDADEPVTPNTALVVDKEGRLTYTGADGRRRVIVGNPELLRRLTELRSVDGDRFESGDGFEGGCGI